jgi:serine/threonine protein kinase
MGSVYKMVRGELRFFIAVKIMHRDLAARPEFVKLFLEEARILKQVGHHENLVPIHDYATLSDGVPFIVMELLEGRSLGSALRAQGIAHKPLDRGAALKIVHEICAAVFELHSQGIVHRDLKPDNVFLLANGAVKVLDCGLAYKRIIDPRVPDAEQASTYEKGQGTPKYMAPEQVRGDEVSPQTDQYAIALILCEILLGRLPFNLPPGASVQQLMDAHVWLSPLPLSQFLDWVSPALSAAVLASLDKDPAKRLRSVFELQTRIYAEAERLRLGLPPELGTASDANITTPTPMTFEELGLHADAPHADPVNRTQPLLRKETMRMETAPTHPARGGMLWQASANAAELRPEAPVAPLAVAPVSPAPAAVHRTPDPRPWPSQHPVMGGPVPQPVVAVRREAAAQPTTEGQPFDARSSQPKMPRIPSNPDTSTAKSLSYEPAQADTDSHAMGRTLRRRVIIRAAVGVAGLALGGLLIVAAFHFGSSPARSAAAPAITSSAVQPVAPTAPAIVPSAATPPAPAAAARSSTAPVVPMPPAVIGSAPPPVADSPGAVPLPAPAAPPASSTARAAAQRPTPVKAKPKPAASDGSDDLFRPWSGGH